MKKPVPFYSDSFVTIYHGDNREIIPALAESGTRFSACVTDPLYGLKFMGAKWDYDVPSVAFWQTVHAALLPGAHVLSFGGSRTCHRIAVSIEDAGFELRDTIMWLYGSGFPKSLDVSKAIDKAAGAKRRVEKMAWRSNAPGTVTDKVNWIRDEAYPITSAATDDAKKWQGWGSSLKPAHEPVCVARKPLECTVAANVLKHGTGALNIDAGRVGTISEKAARKGCGAAGQAVFNSATIRDYNPSAAGRWPANVIHDGSDEVLAGFPESNRAGGIRLIHKAATTSIDHGDSGNAGRFFYCAKASRSEREAGLKSASTKSTTSTARNNTHPTVKPLSLMRYLLKLVCHADGIVIDPFGGSGSTAVAAKQLGFPIVIIERERKYCQIAAQRVAAAAYDPAWCATRK